MTTLSLPHVKDRTGPAERSQPPRSPAPAAEDFASPILGLQQAAGNQAVGFLLGGGLLQPKLRIGPPGDAYEREADRVADAVLREGDAGLVAVSRVQPLAGLQRMCAECEEEMLQRECQCQEEDEEELVQPKAEGAPSPPAPGFEARVASLRGSGRPLPPSVRSFFEPRFGNDFGAVRVHTGATASEAAQAVRARAFTVGSDVVFGAGEWSPGTTAGKHLLAHELTHVVQQTPLVARRQPLLQRASQETGEQVAPAEGFAPEPESPEPALEEEPAPETSPGEPASEAAATAQAPAVALIVADDAAEVGEGQMRKSDFLAQLRLAVLAASEAGLSDKIRMGQANPFFELWLGGYAAKAAEQINGDLQRLVPGEQRPTTAEGCISAVAEKVRTTVATWERTGELPPELSLFGSELPGAGGLLGGLGGVSFKALSGGPRNPGSPQALRAQLGAGRPLDGAIRSRMESAFGRSFSHVRVHADESAAGLSDRLNARAFTVGEHVAFGSRQYRPGTVLGDALLAHELAHVAQQDGASEAVQPMRADAASDGALERDADMAAVGAVASLWGLRLPGLRLPLRAAPLLNSGLRLQRCKSDDKERTPAPAPSTAPAAPAPSQAGPPAAGGVSPEAARFAYGEVRSYCYVSGKGFPAPAGLADLVASVAAACSRGNKCHPDGPPGPKAGAQDRAAWNNITAATSGRDLTGGGNLMCVGSEACKLVHQCSCPDRTTVERPQPLTASGTVTVQGASGGTVYFYNLSALGQCSKDERTAACPQQPRR